MRRPTAIGFAVPVLALMLGLTACSGSAEAPSTGGSPSTADSYAEAFDDYTISLAGCLRDQGFDVEDPEPGTAPPGPPSPTAEPAPMRGWADADPRRRSD